MSVTTADEVVLPPCTRPLPRAMKHPRLMHYNRLILFVVGANLSLAAYGVSAGRWWSGSSVALRTIATIAQANFVLAVLPRQQWMVNLVGWLATRPSTGWPKRMRWTLAKYYHFGGLHVGGAVAGTLWYLVFVASLTFDSARRVGNVAPANLALSYGVVVVFIAMAVLAMPRFRATAHDRFEATHRFGAWISLVLVWANTIVFVGSQSAGPLAPALLVSPTAWMLAATTAGAIWPWLLLRRVKVSIERPSSHVALVRLDHGVKPPIGTTRAISRKPFLGWHHFANVPAPAEEPGYRMVVSRAGDWTADFIDDPPEHVWVRGVPAVGVANVKRLFHKVVYVVTGSGIGPALGHLLADEIPARLVWVTRDPQATYGEALFAEVMTAQPDAIIWNTDVQGKPDVLRLAYAAFVDSGAEAVICISNKSVTWQVVHGLERRGIPAFGPIWDS